MKFIALIFLKDKQWNHGFVVYFNMKTLSFKIKKIFISLAQSNEQAAFTLHKIDVKEVDTTEFDIHTPLLIACLFITCNSVQWRINLQMTPVMSKLSKFPYSLCIQTQFLTKTDLELVTILVECYLE